MYRTVPYRWIVFCLLALAYALAFTHRMSPTVVSADLQQDFAASSAMVGLLVSAYFFPYAFMQAPCGVLTDRLGTRRLVTTALIIAGLGSVLFSLSSSIGLAFTGRVMVGFGLSMILVPTYKALSYWFPAKDFILLSSMIISIATGLGVMLSGTPLAILSTAFGWRACFLGLSLVTMLLGVLVWFMVRDKPQDMGYPPVEAASTESGSGAIIPVKQALLQVVKRWDFWMLGISFCMSGAIYFSFSGLWVGSYLTFVGGLTKAQMGTVISGIAVAGVLAPISMAYLARRVGSLPIMLFSVNIACLLVILWACARNGSWEQGELVLWALLMAYMFTAPPGLFFTSIKDRVPLSIAGTATGLLYAFPMLGSALFQPLVGKILDMNKAGAQPDAQAFGAVFLFYATCMVVATLTIVLMRPKKQV